MSMFYQYKAFERRLTYPIISSCNSSVSLYLKTVSLQCQSLKWFKIKCECVAVFSLVMSLCLHNYIISFYNSSYVAVNG